LAPEETREKAGRRKNEIRPYYDETCVVPTTRGLRRYFAVPDFVAGGRRTGPLLLVLEGAPGGRDVIRGGFETRARRIYRAAGVSTLYTQRLQFVAKMHLFMNGRDRFR
jgi:hypothetical protein